MFDKIEAYEYAGRAYKTKAAAAEAALLAVMRAAGVNDDDERVAYLLAHDTAFRQRVTSILGALS